MTRSLSAFAAAATLAIGIGLASPAAACNPPPGLDFGSYANLCGNTIMQLYARQRPPMSVQDYAVAWYRVYLARQQQAPQPSVQTMMQANRDLQALYDQQNAAWSRRFNGR